MGTASAASLFCHRQHPVTFNTGSCFSTNFVTVSHTAACVFISNGELQLFILKYLQPTCLKSWLHSHVTSVFSSALLFTRQNLKREIKLCLMYYAEAKQSCNSAPLDSTHSRQCPDPRAGTQCQLHCSSSEALRIGSLWHCHRKKETLWRLLSLNDYSPTWC